MEAMAISRQEMMVTWTRVEAKETVRSLLILDIVKGRIIQISYQIRCGDEKNGEIEDKFRKFNLIAQVILLTLN